MKSEPDSYGIEHLKKDATTPWSGVRNFQARNYMQKEMHVGDQVLFYHSSTKEPGVYGLAKVASSAYPDPTQFDESSDYYDKRSTKEKPIWFLVDVAYVATLKKPVLISTLRAEEKTSSMHTLQKGSRLSITPVTQLEFDRIIELSK